MVISSMSALSLLPLVNCDVSVYCIWGGLTVYSSSTRKEGMAMKSLWHWDVYRRQAAETSNDSCLLCGIILRLDLVVKLQF